MTAGSSVVDVNDATFESAVIAESQKRPVVVDFWAPWCGPCRVLSPIIEQVAAEAGDEVLVAKINTDENPRTAMQYRIEGIPAVKAFRDGRVVAEFTGALPEPQVREFFAQLVLSPAEKAVREAEQIADSGDFAAAEARFREVLADAPTNADALVGLAAILLDRGEQDEADELIERALPDRRAKALKHEIFLTEFAAKHDAAELEREARDDPADPRARYRWGVMLASREQWEAALDELLESVRMDRHFADEAARKAMLAVFDILGMDAPIVRDYQRRLGSVLF